MTQPGQLRELPSVDEVMSKLAAFDGRFPRAVIAGEVRRALDAARDQIRAGGTAAGDIETIAERIEMVAERNLLALEAPSLRRVINATGVVLHTNLGRAPLADLAPSTGYSNLEYDLAAGARGKRDAHTAELLRRLTGAPAIAVNNNAAAVYLAVNELAAGHEAIVSRGELIEIGDGFRIPDIMQRAGAILREVGTTNRTRLEDYRAAINERTRLLLRVHPSNFRIQGFASKPDLRELAALGKERGIPVYEDLGSGCIADLRGFGVDEPLATDSLKAGVDLVSFSGDKLLGGPQAGILAGRGELVARLRRNPMFRALRLDKMIYGALETTLRHLLLERWDRIPALRMIAASAGEIRARAEAFAAKLPGLRAEIVAGESVIGGGSTPQQSLTTWLIAIAAPNVVEAERRCRLSDPPVIARIAEGRLVLDLRTVFSEEEGALERVVRQACAS